MENTLIAHQIWGVADFQTISRVHWEIFCPLGSKTVKKHEQESEVDHHQATCWV